MALAIRLARRGLYTTQPNPRVGCVIIRDGQIVGQGFHIKAGEPHAEILALKQAGEEAEHATVYVTLEPCSHTGRTPPCADALIAAKVSRVIVAMKDPNPLVAGSGIKRLKQAGIIVETGMLQQQAEALNPGFITRMRERRPWVRVKLAMSLDGRTAMASGESQWITGEAARYDVQKLRARSCAVLTGINTVVHDDPSMNVRLGAEALSAESEPVQPLRVVIDTDLRTPPTAKIVHLPGKVALFHHSEDKYKLNQLQIEGVYLHKVRLVDGWPDLRDVMQVLVEYDVNECHVESGSKLAGSLLQAGLIDELVIYMAPHLMGANAFGLFELPGLEKMSQRIRLDITDIRKIGHDWRITAKPQSI